VQEDAFPLSVRYFASIGQTWQQSGDYKQGPAKGRRGKKTKAQERTATAEPEAMVLESGAAVDMVAPAAVMDAGTEDQDSGQQAEVSKPADANGTTEEQPLARVASDASIEIITDDTLKYTNRPDFEKLPLREKKQIDFRHTMYLAPLTTNGNLPFRRLCVGYGAEVGRPTLSVTLPDSAADHHQ
jgi:tRNA-dihydrouridine synthase 3